MYSLFEKVWLLSTWETKPHKEKQSTRLIRSAWACHAGLAGLIKFIYETSGETCENNQISNLKKTLFEMTSALEDLQRMVHIVNGKKLFS